MVRQVDSFHAAECLGRCVAAMLATILALPLAARGEVRLPAVFSHNMVLQQNQEVAVWGWADAGERVTVAFAGREAMATADGQGRWKTTLRVPPADGKPGEFVVKASNRIVLDNVVAGEVWLCSGQSNMKFEVAGARNAKVAIAAADLPLIRLFKVTMRAAPEPEKDLQGQWTVCSPKTVGGFSAVGFFLGRRLHRDLNVPVGLIDSTSGGTAVEAWVRRATLEADPQMRPLVRPAGAFFETVAQYDRDLAEWERARAEKRVPLPPAPRSPYRGAGYPTSVFYNAMIAPLVPYGIKGVAWYQGEAKTGRQERYGHELTTLIQDWRGAWGSPFPFLVVQLPNIKPKWDWHITREQQFRVARTVPGVGMAVTIDVGDPDDLHPRNKEPVGERLALAAEAIAYGRKVAYTGPIFDSMQVEGNKIRLRFTNVAGKLVARGGELAGFTIAGSDRSFVPAKAAIEGDTIVVFGNAVDRPIAVRYALEDNPTCNLFDSAGLPAGPFRTDDWPLRRR